MQTVTQFLALVLIAAIPACAGKKSGGYNRPDSFQVGAPLQSYVPRYMAGLHNKESIFIADEAVQRIHHFDLETKQLMKSFKVTPAASHGILAGKSGEYLIDVTATAVDILKADGSTVHNPVNIAGKPKTSTFNPAENLFVIADEYGSIGVMQLDDSGNVTGKFLGGSKLGAADFVQGGELLAGGRLVLALFDKSVAVVDIAATIAQQKWVYSQTQPFPENYDWLARTPLNKDWIVAFAKGFVDVINVTTGVVVGHTPFAGTLIDRFRDLDPHFFVRDAQGVVAMYSLGTDGTFVPEEFVMDLPSLAYSVLDREVDILTVIATAGGRSYDASQILRIRLSDNLLLSKQQTSSAVRAGITRQHTLLQYETRLGYLEVFDASGDLKTPHVISGFNVPYY